MSQSEDVLEDSFSDHSRHSLAYSDDSHDQLAENNDNNVKLIHINNNTNNKKIKIFHNTPHGIEHFIGEQHEAIFGSVYEDLTVDNMYPFIVLLGSEGIGKSCIATEICHELIDERNHLFCDGILYCDLLKMHKEDKCKTFEQCLIKAIHQSGLDTEKYDEFFDMTPANVCSKVHEYLQKSLIVFEDFDRFKEVNNLSLEDCNKFLFDLFENISMETKIIVTSRHKLPIYYNFNMFVTKFYKIEGFEKADAIEYLSTYCPFVKEEIVPYLDDIRDLTAYKPSYLYSVYKLWQSVGAFESTFDAIIHLYSQLEKPQLLINHNPFNDKDDINKIIPMQSTNNKRPKIKGSRKNKSAVTKNTLSPHTFLLDNSTSTANNSSVSSYSDNMLSSSPSLNLGSGSDVDTPLPDTPPDTNLDVVGSYNAKQPLFGYTNVFLTSSPSKSYHSPLSTMNGFEFPGAYGVRRYSASNSKEKNLKSYRKLFVW